MAKYRYVLADVFTDTPLTGNQLAVFTDARGLDAEAMQAIAREMNLPETTFVLPAEEGGTARARIFTPRVELPFAGHPTLGTAWVLAAPLQLTHIHLELGVGIVSVALERDASGRLAVGRMEQPVPSVEPYAEPESLLAALGVSGSELPVEMYDNGARHVIVVLPSPDDVASLTPDLVALEPHDLTGTECVARAGGAWKLRMFGPHIGIAEDPATGSAAGPLACHLCRHGLVPWGEEITITQGVEIGRPSQLLARAEGADERVDRVEVAGSAVIVARGELRL